ncbi:MAG: hypothetical protein LWW85_05135 [Marinilabiliales bacterium]|nr:hypothetical protein [Marinilabiliales bacterium]
MLLQVNLIPSLAFALVNTLFGMAGVKSEANEPIKKQAVVCMPVSHREASDHTGYVTVDKEGRLTLSSTPGPTTPIWRIPFTPGKPV